MMWMLRVCLMLVVSSKVTSQLLGDDNTDTFVPRSQVADKACGYIHYKLDTQVINGQTTIMVDRSKFEIRHFGRSQTFDCPDGLLFSLLSYLCVCSVSIPDNQRFNQDRCIIISGDFQVSDVFEKQQRSPSGFVVSTSYIGQWGNKRYNAADGCVVTNADDFFTLPFFDGNSISRSKIDFSVSFSVHDENLQDGVFLIFSTSPCTRDDAEPSFVVTYVKDSGRSLVVVAIRLRDGYTERGREEDEVSLTYRCPLDSFQVGQQTYTFNAKDPSNTIRVMGEINNPGGIRLMVNNAATSGQSGLPDNGFCPLSTVNSLFPLRGKNFGQNIIAERNCLPTVGQAPSNSRMCVHSMRIQRDC